MNIKNIDLEVALDRAEKDLEVRYSTWMKSVAVYKDALDRHKEEISKLKWSISDAQADYEHYCEAYDTLLENQEVLPNEA